MLDELTNAWIQPLAAFVAAGSFVLFAGPAAIRVLGRLCRETIRQDSPRLHALMAAKAATPTMGGLLIVAGFLATVCLTAEATPRLLAMMALAAGLAVIGAWDDLAKRRSSRPTSQDARRIARRGISAGTKLLSQLILATGIVSALSLYEAGRLDVLEIAAAVLVIVGMSNAVNLTDGLDGLACGCSLIWLAACAAMAVQLGAATDLLAPMAALSGAVLGFLRFNWHPARVFMGDTGSLPLGGLLGWFAFCLEGRLPLLVLSGVFLAEIVSVVLQVGWFRSTGERLLLCAPLHHHFQYLGWPERAIVRRFWLAGLICAFAGLGLFHLHTKQLPSVARAGAPLPHLLFPPVQP